MSSALFRTSRLFSRVGGPARRQMGGGGVHATGDPNAPITLLPALGVATFLGAIGAVWWKQYHFKLMRATNAYYDELDKKMNKA